jgi:hypothetical protein
MKPGLIGYQNLLRQLWAHQHESGPMLGDYCKNIVLNSGSDNLPASYRLFWKPIDNLSTLYILFQELRRPSWSGIEFSNFNNIPKWSNFHPGDYQS